MTYIREKRLHDLCGVGNARHAGADGSGEKIDGPKLRRMIEAGLLGKERTEVLDHVAKCLDSPSLFDIVEKGAPSLDVFLENRNLSSKPRSHLPFETWTSVGPFGPQIEPLSVGSQAHRLYVVATEDRAKKLLIAIDLASGELHEIASFAPSNSTGSGIELNAQVAVAEKRGLLFVVSREKDQPMRLHALHASSGERLWEIEISGSTNIHPSPPVLSPDESKLFVCFEGQLHAVDVETGTIRWSIASSGHDIQPSPDGKTVAVNSNGRLELLEAKTGAKLWKRPVEAPVQYRPYPQVAFSECGTRLFVCSEEAFLGIDRATGEVKWSVPRSQTPKTRANVWLSGDGKTLFGLDCALETTGQRRRSTRLHRLDPGTGEALAPPLTLYIGYGNQLALLETEAAVLLGTDEDLFRVDLSTDSVTPLHVAKPQCSRISQFSLSPDGSIAYVPSFGGKGGGPNAQIDAVSTRVPQSETSATAG